MKTYLAVVVGFLLCGLVLAEATKARPTVIITKTDSSTVRGLLSNYTPFQLSLDVTTGSGKEKKTETVTLKWDEVDKISTGLTRKRAVEEFKREHPEGICPKCRGDGDEKCRTCYGTGHDPVTFHGCDTCKGGGQVECTNGCKMGKIRCPGNCLKQSVGEWKPKGRGFTRKLGSGKGSANVSEKNFGEIWDQENGKWVNKGKCPICKGTTEIECARCEGTGLLPCPECMKKKDALKCKDCTDGRAKCKECDGLGIKKQG